MAFSTFGVTSSTLSRYVHRLTFDTDTSPTATEAGEIINDRAAEWCAFLDSVGIPAATRDGWAATDESYRLSHSWIARAAAVDCSRARGHRNTELEIAMAEERDAIKQTMRDRVSELGDQRPTGASAANFPHTDVQRATQRTAALATGSLGSRMANRGSV